MDHTEFQKELRETPIRMSRILSICYDLFLLGEPDYLLAIHSELHTLVEMRTLLSFTLWSVQVVLCAVFFSESWWVAWRRGVWLHNCWRCVRFMYPEWLKSDMSLLRWYWRWCSCRPPRRKLKMECSSYRSWPIVGSFQGLRPFKSELDVFLLLSSARNRDIFATQVPGLCREVPHTRVDWNYTISPQAGLNGRGPGYSRGKLLGGCSSHSKWSGILKGPADQVWFSHQRWIGIHKRIKGWLEPIGGNYRGRCV